MQERDDPPDPGTSRQLPRITLTTIIAAFGLFAAVVSFIFLIDPSLRPDPRERQAGTLAVVGLDRGVSFLAYAGRLGLEASPDVTTKTVGQKCIPGSVVYLLQSLEGFKRRQTSVRFLTYDAATGARLRGVFPEVSGGEPVVRFTGEAPSDQSVSLHWVQWPFRTGVFFIRAELFHGFVRSKDFQAEGLLAVADTPKFSVTKDRYGELHTKCVNWLTLQKPPEGAGFQEGFLSGGGGGFDIVPWLTWGAIVGGALLIGAAIASAVGRLRRHPSGGTDG